MRYSSDFLLACPFCGRRDAPTLDSSLEDLDDEMAELLREDEQWRIVCDIHQGGCGSAGGYQESPSAAAEAWNGRVSRAAAPGSVAPGQGSETKGASPEDGEDRERVSS